MVILEDVRELFEQNMATGTEGGTGAIPKQRRHGTVSDDEEEVEQKPADILKAGAITLTKQGEVAVNADEALQRKLVLLQAQQTHVVGNLRALQDQLEIAQRDLEGDVLARKYNTILRVLDSSEGQMNRINAEMQPLLTADQLQQEMAAVFTNQMLLEDFRSQLQEYQMCYFTKHPSSVAKPLNMVVSVKPKAFEDTKFAKLPPIEMPTFGGDYTQWTPFLDQFDSMVGSKKSYEDTTKLHYLKQALRGDAKALISRLENNNAGNYALARQILKKRYENKRTIVASHISNIVNAQSVKAENGTGLRRYLQLLQDNLEGLRQVNIPTDGWGPLLVYHVYQKLDNDTKKEYEIKYPGTEVQKLDDIVKFLNDRAVALEAYASTATKAQGNQNQKSGVEKKDAKGGSYASQQGQGNGWVAKPRAPCVKCNGEHGIWKCDQFGDQTVDQRIKTVKELELCLNCLSKDHIAADCPSKHRCKTCNKLHHSLLHIIRSGGGNPHAGKPSRGSNHLAVKLTKKQAAAAAAAAADVRPGKGDGGPVGTPPAAAAAAPQVTPAPVVSSVATPAGAQGTTVVVGTPEVPHAKGSACAGFEVEEPAETAPLLGTALVPIRDSSGELRYGRALLDSGSQLNFITDKFAKTLGLQKLDSKCTVHTIGAVLPSATIGSIRFDIEFPERDHVPVLAHILSKVTGVLPSQRLRLPEDFGPQLSDLADPDFYIPGEIDLLIGVEVYEELMMDQKRRQGRLTMTRSRLGWVVTGTAPVADDDDPQEAVDPFVGHVLLDKQILTFWEINDLRDTSVLAKAFLQYTEEEKFVHQHFNDTTVVGLDGRFGVSLPFRKPVAGMSDLVLGCSRGAAVRMLLVMEVKFGRNEVFFLAYQAFVREFIDMGHLVLVSEEQLLAIPNSKKYFLPHHAVEKTDSTTTKLRVVMNASAKSTTGVTLNDKIAVGPVLQDQLVCHLVRYRFHRVALSGDISKMYRQIALNAADRWYHLFLWRDSPDEPIRVYQMTRVTYGVASSCYHSIRAMQEAAKASNMPKEVVDAVLRDFYVDDIMSGADSVKEAEKLMLNLIRLLQQSQLPIRKWASSEPSIISALPEELRENVSAFDVQDPEHEQHTLKTLGIRWHPAGDLLRVHCATCRR